MSTNNKFNTHTRSKSRAKTNSTKDDSGEAPSIISLASSSSDPKTGLDDDSSSSTNAAKTKEGKNIEKPKSNKFNSNSKKRKLQEEKSEVVKKKKKLQEERQEKQRIQQQQHQQQQQQPKILYVKPGAFKDESFKYMNETLLIWNKRDFFANKAWRDEALKRARARKKNQKNNPVTKRKKAGNVKRFHKILDDFLARSNSESESK